MPTRAERFAALFWGIVIIWLSRMMAGMFDSSPLIASDRSHLPHPHSDRAVAELLQTVVHRRKRSAVLLALTGQLLADTRELLARCSIAMNRTRYPARRRSKREALAARRTPRNGPRR